MFCDSGYFWNPCQVTKFCDTKFPCAPESSRAVMATGFDVLSLLILIGSNNARLFSVVSSCTRLRTRGSEESLELGDTEEAHRAADLRFKNPRRDA